MNESTIREQGINWDIVHQAFLWSQLSKDFIRELVEGNKIFKKNLEYELLCDLHGWSVHPSCFYQNMFCYLNNGLALRKELQYHMHQIYIMYRQQAEKEYNARREVVHYVDGSGRVLDSITYGG